MARHENTDASSARTLLDREEAFLQAPNDEIAAMVAHLTDSFGAFVASPAVAEKVEPTNAEGYISVQIARLSEGSSDWTPLDVHWEGILSVQWAEGEKGRQPFVEATVFLFVGGKRVVRECQMSHHSGPSITSYIMFRYADARDAADESGRAVGGWCNLGWQVDECREWESIDTPRFCKKHA
jgi:hypothetical protein